MKRLSIVILVLALMILFSSTTLAAGKKVFVSATSFSDAWTIGAMTSKATMEFSARGWQVVTNKEEADVVFNMNLLVLSHRIYFNWLYLLLPMWPLVPWTRCEADASISVTATEGATKLLENQYSDSVKGRFFLGDFDGLFNPDAIRTQAVNSVVVKAIAAITQ